MTDNSISSFASHLSKHLLWFGIINLLVGIKLIASFVVPGLKTPGELILSGCLLLVYTVKIWSLRSKVDKFAKSS